MPQGYIYSFEASIFHDIKHLSHQGKEYLSFYILHEKKRNVLGHIFFHISNHTALSPLKASYGGIECSPSVDLRIIWKFIEYVEEQLRRNNIKSIKITLPPLVYELSSYSKISNSHFEKGYLIYKWETGACIEIKQNNYDTLLAEDEIRRLKKFKNEDLIIEVSPLSHIKEVYNFISKCRIEKRYNLSMSFDDVKQISDIFPDRFILFTIRNSYKIIAASIAIQVKEHILYNFFSAHDFHFNRLSPPLGLFEFMYEYCKENEIELLDLGTSHLEENPNFNLIHFKEHAGAILAPKFFFTKNLS